MCDQDGGVIVNIIAATGTVCFADFSPYSENSWISGPTGKKTLLVHERSKSFS
jgi:hypothetical protein